MDGEPAADPLSEAAPEGSVSQSKDRVLTLLTTDNRELITENGRMTLHASAMLRMNSGNHNLPASTTVVTVVRTQRIELGFQPRYPEGTLCHLN